MGHGKIGTTEPESTAIRPQIQVFYDPLYPSGLCDKEKKGRRVSRLAC